MSDCGSFAMHQDGGRVSWSLPLLYKSKWTDLGGSMKYDEVASVKRKATSVTCNIVFCV